MWLFLVILYFYHFNLIEPKAEPTETVTEEVETSEVKPDEEKPVELPVAQPAEVRTIHAHILFYNIVTH